MYQHRGRGIVLAFAVASALLVPTTPAGAQTPADNTKVNTRDRAEGAATADQQKENTTDREITQKIRRALMDDKTPQPCFSGQGRDGLLCHDIPDRGILLTRPNP